MLYEELGHAYLDTNRTLKGYINRSVLFSDSVVPYRTVDSLEDLDFFMVELLMTSSWWFRGL